MKRIKMAVSAFVVLTLVGVGLAFKAKAFIFSNVYCFPHTQTVVTTEKCSWDPLESTCRHASLSIL